MSKKLNVYFESLDGGLLEIWKKVRNELSSTRVSRWISSATKSDKLPLGCLVTTVIDGTSTQDPSFRFHYYNDESATYECLNDRGLVDVVGRVRGDETFVIVGREQRKKGKLIAFADAPHKLDLPDKFTKVEWVCGWDELRGIYEREIKFKNILEDDSRFRRTGWVAHCGEHCDTPIYEGLCDPYKGHYFYRDQLHGRYQDPVLTDHFEVFDGHKKHVGEMNLNGEIDWSKADSQKRWPVRT